jgi:hypothetical protein
MVGSPEITERVVEAMASHTDADPVELPRLYESLDPDALEATVKTLADGEVSFQYAGHTVTVDSGGAIKITDPLPAD